MQLADNHSHIILADIESMVQSAKSHNLKIYSITEHVFQFREPRETIDFGAVHRTGRIFESIEEYRREFAKFTEQSEMRIRKGLEVDFSPRYEVRVGDFVNQESWDILLCSVHELEDGSDIETNKGKPIEANLAHELWRNYLKLEHMALESDFVPFSVLTHPVRLSRGTKVVPEDLDDLLLDLAKAAKRRDKALELNGNDLEFAPELVYRLARACSRSGCKVSLGSDAHYPKEVFRKMKDAMALVEEFQLETV